MFTDEELETYIDKIQTCNKTNNKILYYKKAVKRLDKLRQQYESMVLKLTSTEDIETTSDTNISIEVTIKKLSELQTINNIEEYSVGDVSELIDTYVTYKKLIENLTNKISGAKNDIHSVSIGDKEFVLTKINLDML